jgi:hypothetical protein
MGTNRIVCYVDGQFVSVPDAIVRLRLIGSKLHADTEFKRYRVDMRTGRVRCVGLLSGLK